MMRVAKEALPGSRFTYLLRRFTSDSKQEVERLRRCVSLINATKEMLLFTRTSIFHALVEQGAFMSFESF